MNIFHYSFMNSLLYLGADAVVHDARSDGITGSAIVSSADPFNVMNELDDATGGDTRPHEVHVTNRTLSILIHQ